MCGCLDVYRQNLEPSLVSIFTDTSVRRLEDAANTHVFNVAPGSAAHTGSYHVITAGSYLADDSTAVFAIALQNAGLLIIKLPVIGSRGIVMARLAGLNQVIIFYQTSDLSHMTKCVQCAFSIHCN